MTEYVLQKRTLSMWSYVTWYDDLEQGLKNLNSSFKDSGYSWRLVKLTVIEEKLNGGELELEPDGLPDGEDQPEGSDTLVTHQFATDKPAGEFKSSWGVPSTDFKNEHASEPDLKPSHGLAGSVWMVHFGLKRKTRVPLAEMEGLIAQGYVKGSPRTVFI